MSEETSETLQLAIEAQKKHDDFVIKLDQIKEMTTRCSKTNLTKILLRLVNSGFDLDLLFVDLYELDLALKSQDLDSPSL